jgi:hypothetical protein
MMLVYSGRAFLFPLAVCQPEIFVCIYTAMHTTRAHGATMCQPEKKEKKFLCKKSFVSFYYLQPMYKAAAERERASKQASAAAVESM